MQILKSEKHGVIVNRARDAESYHDMNKLAFINEQNQKQMNIILVPAIWQNTAAATEWQKLLVRLTNWSKSLANSKILAEWKSWN